MTTEKTVEELEKENNRLRRAIVRADKLRTGVAEFLKENEPILPSEHKLRRLLDAFDASLLPPSPERQRKEG